MERFAEPESREDPLCFTATECLLTRQRPHSTVCPSLRIMMPLKRSRFRCLRAKTKQPFQLGGGCCRKHLLAEEAEKARDLRRRRIAAVGPYLIPELEVRRAQGREICEVPDVAGVEDPGGITSRVLFP